MKPTNPFNSETRAVSPVIGVILMVAITVILAAVIGTFVLGLGDSLGDNQPMAQLSVDFDEVNSAPDTLTIEHNGGDRIESGTLNVIVTDIENDSEVSGPVNPALSVGESVTGDLESGESSGTSATDVRVRIIHNPSESVLVDRTLELSDSVGIEDDFDTTFES